MRFHWQNLNEGGSPIRNGRAWFHIGNQSLNIEWGIKPKLRLAASCSIGGGSDSHATIHINLFGVYLFVCPTTFLTRPLHRWAVRHEGTETGIEIKWERTLQMRMDLATKPFSWSSTDPWYRKGLRIDFADLIFGRHKYTKVDHETRDVLIPMPEGCYPAKATRSTCTWKRPRWISKPQHEDIWLDIPGGIPHAGKGENGWDCGDDGLFGTGARDATIEEAIGKAVASALRSRARYGHASDTQGRPAIMARQTPAPTT